MSDLPSTSTPGPSLSSQNPAPSNYSDSVQNTMFSADVLQALLEAVNYSNQTSGGFGKSPETGPEIDAAPVPTRAFSPLAMRISLYFICVVGIILNVAVFCKRKFETKRQSYTTRISLQLLCFMAIADTISLASLLLVLCTQYLGIQNETVMDMICKIDLFLIHSSSAFSIWCWLVLSAVRYVALYRPYAHLRLNNEPLMAVVFLVVMCSTFESWILYDATYFHEYRGCGEVLSETWEKRFQVVEICWSYFLPVVVITVLDFKVLCCHQIWFSDLAVVKSFDGSIKGHYSRTGSKNMKRQFTVEEYADSPLPVTTPASIASSVLHTHSRGSKKLGSTPEQSPALVPLTSPELASKQSPLDPCQCPKTPTIFSFASTAAAVRSNSGSKKTKRRLKQMKILRRCLLITLLDLGMNLPNYLFRLYINLIPMEDIPDPNDFWFGLFQDISQLLYFAQFSLNAFYLICIIYDTPKKRQQSCNINTLNNITIRAP